MFWFKLFNDVHDLVNAFFDFSYSLSEVSEFI